MARTSPIMLARKPKRRLNCHLSSYKYTSIPLNDSSSPYTFYEFVKLAAGLGPEKFCLRVFFPSGGGTNLDFSRFSMDKLLDALHFPFHNISRDELYS